MLKIPSSVDGHSTVIIPIKPRFCIDITSIPKDAVVAKRTVAFAVTCHLFSFRVLSFKNLRLSFLTGDFNGSHVVAFWKFSFV